MERHRPPMLPRALHPSLASVLTIVTGILETGIQIASGAT